MMNGMIFDSAHFSSRRRNYMLTSHRKDGLIEWLKEMMTHSFVLDATGTYSDTMSAFEELVEEHRLRPDSSRLRAYVPTVGRFHTSLPMRQAFEIYDEKYSVSRRRQLPPTFNEIRHILNLAQVLALGKDLSLLSFDGDQTLYSDGGNFEDNDELARGIILLMKAGVRCALITAAGYGLDGSKYEVRLRGLLDRFVLYNLTSEEVSRFLVFGGECNYLLQCGYDDAGGRVVLKPIAPEVWQAPHVPGPKPANWPATEVTQLLDIAEESMKDTIAQMHLRARIIRKDRAIGVIPGGDEMTKIYPKGHGSTKIKREALDELVLRVMEAIRVVQPPVTLPFCVFNGGRDTWLDVGNKRVGVEALQAFYNIPPSRCLHVGDQFLNTGNDLSARETCACIWITSPRETEKIQEHVLRVMGLEGGPRVKMPKVGDQGGFNAWTGEES